jgi:hypothetical protein
MEHRDKTRNQNMEGRERIWVHQAIQQSN